MSYWQHHGACRAAKVQFNYSSEIALTRNGALDILKVLLALTVIGMHTRFLTDVSPFGAYLTSNGLFRAAVPLFLLINGYFFYQTVAASSSAKWFKRVLLLYAVWMAIYLPFWPVDILHPNGSHAAWIIRTLFFGYYHLWYLIGMVGAAAVLLLLHKRGTRFLSMATMVTFATGVGIQYLSNYHLVGSGLTAKLFSQEWASRNFLFFAFPFFCLGFIIRKHKLNDYLSSKRAALLAIAGLTLLMLESCANFFLLPTWTPFDNLASLIIVCPAVFMLAIKLEFKTNSKELALYSTGIYLVHILVMWFLAKYVFMPTALTALTAALSAAAAHILIRLNRRVTYLL